MTDTVVKKFLYNLSPGSEAAHYLSKHLLNKVMKHQQEANVQSSQELLSNDELIRKVRKTKFIPTFLVLFRNGC
jgi:hypothetical protein